MKIVSTTIVNQLGLHARASAKFVSTAARFQSSIEVSKDAHCVNGKSIMGVLMLNAPKGSLLNLRIEGPDEEEMAEALLTLIADRFHEEE